MCQVQTAARAPLSSTVRRQSNVCAMHTAREYLRNWLRWQRGRQGTGYDKLLLVANPLLIPFDLYLLRFPDGTEIPPHKDPVTGKRHYRLNIILKRPRAGG